ncbi:putative sulfate exporter family transporter [Pseudoalteromonas luteoviolacea]|uniref:YeiH family protein n=1 Tax=Pseudoalteromonas luteoviolacea TaxID=43657 RepID=UPI001EEDE2EC|nr:putative sulfate exporter family transporter [Pseudoalteromonas luteoviolacea]MCF6442308.1 putative sulfate exporter family transporter [Pseudoalteromonas luteoviolacea]
MAQISPNYFKALYVICFFACISPVFGSATALFMGITFALLLGNPFEIQSANLSKLLLKISVIGLGFNIDIMQVLEVGRSSLVLTIVSITAIIGLGEILTQLFRLNKNTGTLISFGTAICGGSAIAAMAPVIKAKQDEIAVALAIVFSLNAVGLLIFPWLGHYFELSQSQFAIWSALAIHDTSSVVGAAAAYGPVALAMATTIKLTRAMWIVPYTALAGVFWRSEERTSIPLFIVGFLLAAAINTWLPELKSLWELGYEGAKALLVGTLFLIGSGISKKVLQQCGWQPFIMALILWIIVSSVILVLILDGFIK